MTCRYQQIGRSQAPGDPTPSLGAISSQGWGGIRRPSPPSPSPGLHGAPQDIAVSVAPTAATILATHAGAGAMAGPIGAAIGAGVAAITILIMKFRQTGQQKVAATNIVNKVEPMLQQNRDAYLASNHTQSEQAQSMANFNTLWAIVVSKCSDPALGDAGRRCISERQEGGQAPWGKNWFQMYLDPIRNDPQVNPDPNVVTDPATGNLTKTGTGFLEPESGVIPGVSNMALLIGGGLVLLLVTGMGGDSK